MPWLLPLLSLATAAEDADAVERLRTRYEREVTRCEAKLVEAEGRWVKVCEAPDASDKAVDRATERLVGRRARHERARARLEALGAPEATVRVLFATNRVPDDKTLFGVRDQGRTTYGFAEVRIPADHPVGALERDLEVLAVQPLSEAAFHAELAASTGVDRGALLFVHGYNNSFDYAVRRLAQVSHDLELPVVPVLYSWPSHGGTWFSMAKYTYDENAAARSAAPFADLLGDVLAQQRAPLVVMAHSMGSRVVAEGLADLARRDDLRAIDELVFAAPDIDATVFAQRYADVALDRADRLTLYCADDDRALKLSRQVHGGYDRLGSCRESSLEAVAHPRIEVVDASQLYVDLIDHDKVASSPRLLADLQQVLAGAPIHADTRGLLDAGAWWELPP